MVLLWLVLRLWLHILLVWCILLLLWVLRARDVVLASLRRRYLLLLRLRLRRWQRVRSRSAKVGAGVTALSEELGEGVLLCKLSGRWWGVLLLRRWWKWLMLLLKMGRELVLCQAPQKVVSRLTSAMLLLLLLSREVMWLLLLLLRSKDRAGCEGTTGRPCVGMACNTSTLPGSVHEVLQLLLLVLTRIDLPALLGLRLLLFGRVTSARLALSKLCCEESRHLCLLLLRRVAVAVLGQAWHRRSNAALHLRVRDRRRQLVHVCRKRLVGLRRSDACTPSGIHGRTWLGRQRCKVAA